MQYFQVNLEHFNFSTSFVFQSDNECATNDEFRAALAEAIPKAAELAIQSRSDASVDAIDVMEQVQKTIQYPFRSIEPMIVKLSVGDALANAIQAGISAHNDIVIEKAAHANCDHRV